MKTQSTAKRITVKLEKLGWRNQKCPFSLYVVKQHHLSQAGARLLALFWSAEAEARRQSTASSAANAGGLAR